MAKMMSKRDGKAFLRRWRLVNATEIKELRKTPLEIKLRQLAALMASAKQMGWMDALREEEAAEVRDRWQRLRKAYGIRKGKRSS